MKSSGMQATGIIALFILWLAASVSFTAAPASSAPALKEDFKGLVDPKGKTTNPDIENLVITSTSGGGMAVSWAELEPREGQYDFHVIEDFMASHPGKTFEFRVFCGKNSPQWLFDKVGEVKLKMIDGNGYYHVPKWWTQPYRTAYDQLQKNLAAKYDDDDRLGIVEMAACMVYYDEPFLRLRRQDAFNAKALCDGGLTFAADIQAQKDCFQSHADHWVRTRSAIALNPYDKIDSATSYHHDIATTSMLMDDAAQRLGKRVIFQNNSIRTRRNAKTHAWECNMGTEYDALYAKMKQFAQQGYTIGFQTAYGKAVGDTAATIQACIDYGAHFVEVQPGFDKALSSTQIHDFDVVLENAGGKDFD